MHYGFAALLILLLGFAAHGWGALVRRIGGLPHGTWPMTISLGIAAWVAIGGVLNVSRIAYPPVLAVLLVAGIILSLQAIIRARQQAAGAPPLSDVNKAYRIVWLVLGFVILAGAFVLQAAPPAFNHRDDYLKYLPYIVRMVQTGTLAGNPLSSLGAEALGGQVFLQAPFAAWLPLNFVNSADAVGCLALLVLMTGGLASGRPRLAIPALVAMVAVVAIEPQYVNITALYSAATLAFAATALCLDAREFQGRNGDELPTMALGLLYAALVALKTTMLLFVVMHLMACVLGEVVAARRFGPALRLTLTVSAWTALFLLPWISIYAPHYWNGIVAPLPPLDAPPVPQAETLAILSLDNLIYGGSFALYTGLALAPLVCALPVILRNRWAMPAGARLLLLGLGIPACYIANLVVMGPALAGYATSLRYSVPILLGTVPAILVLCAEIVPPSEGRSLGMGGLAGTAIGLLVVVGFAPHIATRMDIIARTGTQLAYVRWASADAITGFLLTSHDLFHGLRGRQMAELQAQIPPGEPVIVWANGASMLDYARNPIMDLDVAGLSNRWAHTPEASWVIWQYRGFGVRRPEDYQRIMREAGRNETAMNARALAFTMALNAVAQQSEVVADTGEVVLLHVPPGVTLPAP